MTVATAGTIDLFKQAYQTRTEIAPVEPPKPVIEVKPTPTLPAAPKTLSEAVGRSIRIIRKSQGMTLRQLAEKSFVSLGHISDTELGKKDCSGFMLSCIIEGLDVPLSDVLRLAADLLDEGK